MERGREAMMGLYDEIADYLLFQRYPVEYEKEKKKKKRNIVKKGNKSFQDEEGITILLLRWED